MNLPAHQFMRGTHDRVMGMNSRYATHEVRGYFREAALTIVEQFHWNTLLLPAGFVVRHLPAALSKPKSDLERAPLWLDGLLARLMRIDIALCRTLRSPLGCSLFTVARKT